MAAVVQGIVDAGETPIEAAVRELKEETGIDLKGEEQLASLIPAPDAQPINAYTVGKGAAKKTVRLPTSCSRRSDHRGPTPPHTPHSSAHRGL